jgi:hypothetical protein
MAESWAWAIPHYDRVGKLTSAMFRQDAQHFAPTAAHRAILDRNADLDEGVIPYAPRLEHVRFGDPERRYATEWSPSIEVLLGEWQQLPAERPARSPANRFARP